MGMVDGTGLITWEGGLFDPAMPESMDLLRRLKYGFWRLRSLGVRINLNEAGRPFGVPSDIAVGRAGLPASRTLSGRSTVNYQWGRALAGLTPSAANPAGGIWASEHTTGEASDTDTNDMAARRFWFGLLGMIQTIPSESWHFAIRYAIAASIDLSAFADLNIDPFDNEGEEEMAVGKKLLIIVSTKWHPELGDTETEHGFAVNYIDHTFFHIKSPTQADFMKNSGYVDAADEFKNQPWTVLEGLRFLKDGESV